MADEEDVSKLSISERILHKKWKVRLDVYEELIKTISRVDNGKDNIFYEISSILSKIIVDNNAVAQEKD